MKTTNKSKSAMLSPLKCGWNGTTAAPSGVFSSGVTFFTPIYNKPRGSESFLLRWCHGALLSQK